MMRRPRRMGDLVSGFVFVAGAFAVVVRGEDVSLRGEDESGGRIWPRSAWRSRWHAGLVPFGVVLDRQGPPAVSDSPSPAASRRNRENPAPLPANF